MDRKKKKVLLITQHLDAGGIETMLINICNNIDKQKIDIEILCCDTQFMSFEYRFSEFKIHKAAYINSFKGKLSFLNELRKLLHSTKYDVVHSNMGIFDGFTLLVAKYCGVKTRISHGHFIDSQYGSTTLKRAIVRIARIVTKMLIKLCSTDCIACSDEANDYCFDGKGIVIFNGIDFDKFFTEKGKDVSNGKINLITVGRISYAKNPLFIVDVINELSKFRQNFVFTWVGVGGLEKEVKTRINQLELANYFHFLGMRNDVPELMRNNHFFLLPSLAEGLPLSLVEAQACGCDCFVSNNVPHVVDCGKTMFLPIDDARVWANEINNHIEEDMWEINEDLIERFDIRKIVKKIEGIYLK